MPTAARLNDKGTQHDGYQETVIIAGSPTVFVDGLPAARTGDAVDCGGVVIGTGTVN
ncbi:PAAR domain-containing protein, partial [Salmonella enterica]|nr:hypothetical protein [Salmonella enterica subsp. enterica serovar Lattenkamp]EAQ8611250.1 hypothetical protein [Salmonella enterica]EDS3899545.1 hypothetical protein [Salmonella enterica subsp. enterica]EAV2737678.1 hypothetical protein [Salmonella enterica]EBC3929339.1 hypothetical protein [Salmonella enterica]